MRYKVGKTTLKNGQVWFTLVDEMDEYVGLVHITDMHQATLVMEEPPTEVVFSQEVLE